MIFESCVNKAASGNAPPARLARAHLRYLQVQAHVVHQLRQEVVRKGAQSLQRCGTHGNGVKVAGSE